MPRCPHGRILCYAVEEVRTESTGLATARAALGIDVCRPKTQLIAIREALEAHDALCWECREQAQTTKDD